MITICGSGKYLKRAIIKYGIENFTKEILFECSSEEEMNKKEIEIVDEEFVSRLDTYNLKKGGEGGFDYINDHNLNAKSFPPEVIEKLRKNADLAWKTIHQRMKDNPLYAEKIRMIAREKGLKSQKNGNPFAGKTHTAETKRKIGEKNSKYQTGSGNSNYGKCWIYNENEKMNKSVKKEELEDWLKKGWKIGRKMKF